MTAIRYKNTLAVLIGFSLLLLPLIAAAAPGDNISNNSSPGFHLTDPLGEGSTLCSLLKTIFRVLALFAVPISVGFIVYAGFLFVLARGNTAKLTAAKVNMGYTVVGIMLFFGAWFLAQIIANTLMTVGGSSDFNTCF